MRRFKFSRFCNKFGCGGLLKKGGRADQRARAFKGSCTLRWTPHSAPPCAPLDPQGSAPCTSVRPVQPRAVHPRAPPVAVPDLSCEVLNTNPELLSLKLLFCSGGGAPNPRPHKQVLGFWVLGGGGASNPRPPKRRRGRLGGIEPQTPRPGLL